MAPLGTWADLLSGLLEHNTGPENTDDETVLYGPGIRIELGPEDPVCQMLLTVTEEEIGWQVIQRLAHEFSWKLLEPTTGREWTP